MIKLWIEDQEMDTTEGFSHQITYAVDDLNNLDSKATSFSKTIVLPGTARNNYLLGNIFEFNNSNFTGEGANVFYNFNASRSAKCRLDINGMTIIKGVLRLLEIIRDEDTIEYEVAIFGELGGFVSKLSNKKLEDLDFSLYNHQYTISNIKDRWYEKADFRMRSLGFDIINTDSFQIGGQGDLSDLFLIGDEIEVRGEDDNFSLGTGTITSVEYGAFSDIFTVFVDSTLTSSPAGYRYIYTIIDKGGCGVYYPLIDYGTYSSDKHDYNYLTFRPALFVKEYLDKIIKGAGYSYSSKFFNTDFFKRLIIPHNESQLITLKNQLFKGNIYYSASAFVTAGIFVSTGLNSIFINALISDLFTTTDNVQFQYTGTNTTININYVHNVLVAHNSYPNNAGGDFTYEIEVYKNSIATGIKTTLTGTLQLANDWYTQNIYSLNLNGSLVINTGDIIEIKFEGTFKPINNSAINVFYCYTIGTVNYTSINSISAPILIDDFLYVNKAIPKNIQQKDFFTSIIKLFNLMVTEDKYKTNHLNIEPYVWFYNLNTISYLDWSLKLDRSQPIRIKPMSEINARFYDFKFKSDTDYFNDLYKKRYNEGYGDRKYDNQLEFAKDSQSSEVIFASTPLLGYEDEDKIVPTIFKWNGATVGTNEEKVNSIIRIMQAKRITEVSSWDITDATGGTGNTVYPYAGHFDDPDAPNSDLNFGATNEIFFNLTSGALGNNLFNIYYSPYMAEITDKDSRLVTAKFKLNDVDIFNLDFRRFIWLDGVLYRLSKIVDYTPGEICTVELLRVINTTYETSVNSDDNPEISICGQIWSQKNLDVETYRNGDLIPQITDDTEWSTANYGAWCYYENNQGYKEYGKLYNWYAVNDPRGLAPTGWKIPDSEDFIKLNDSDCVNDNSRKIKEPGTTHWNTDDGTNETKFTALGAGKRRKSGTFEQLKDTAYFWTTDEDSGDGVYWSLTDSNVFDDNSIDKNSGFSVRIIRDI